ncbi:MAG TPA: response regulator transcription factor [Solirubrobacteraceae bacterium]|jgi:DNA-binding NarL/FixJ family response regulator|nr:response regulator transcription factor [Solirubrobacteraceae bacterium]
MRMDVIRVLTVDDRPGLRAGVETVLRSAPGIASVGAASDERELWPLLRHTRPEVVLMDYQLPSTDGLLLCHRIKHSTRPPAVLVYSAYADASMAIAAQAAGADGLMDKSAETSELEEAIRRVSRGDRLFPPIPEGLMADAVQRIEPEDRPILGLLLAHAGMGDVAAAAGIPIDAAAGRVQRLIRRLAVDVPAGRGGA